MGVLPLQFKGEDRNSLKLKGDETYDILGIDGDISPRQDITMTINYPNGDKKDVTLLCRIDTADEMDYYRNGGILQAVLRKMLDEE